MIKIGIDAQSTDITEAIYELHLKGTRIADIAKLRGVSTTTIRHHIKKKQALLKRRAECSVNVRTKNALSNMGIEYLEQLSEKSLTDLRRQPNIGKVTIRALYATAQKHDIKLNWADTEDGANYLGVTPSLGRDPKRVESTEGTMRRLNEDHQRAEIPQTKLVYDIDDLCEALCIGKTLAYRLLGSGKIKAKKIGKRTVVLGKDLQDYLDNLPDYSGE